MFTLIQPNQPMQHKAQIEAAMRLRNAVFADQLGWDVPVHGDMEYDEYDSLGSTYLIWSDATQRTVYGVVRLLPTTGPTLLHDVFAATHNSDAALIGAGIHEGTRMCLDVAAVERDHGIDAAEGFSRLLYALALAARTLGIERLVSNFEAATSRIYKRAGLTYRMHGVAGGYGKKPVYCGSFAVTEGVLATMCAAIGAAADWTAARCGFAAATMRELAVA